MNNETVSLSPQDGLRPVAPQGTVLHSTVVNHYPDWLAARAAGKKPICKPVQREFTRYQQCGDPAFGHITLGCLPCDFKVSVPLPCKRRGWCPSCLERRMRSRGDSIINDVFGAVPVRHWVEGLPPQLKQIIGYDPSVLTAVLHCFIREIFRSLRRQAKAELGLLRAAMAHPGAVSVIHLCSADLTPNTHFHCVATDGVFVEDDDGNVSFRQLSPPTVKQIANVARLTCRRTCKTLERRGLWRANSTTKSTVDGILLIGEPRPAKFFGDAAHSMEDGAAPRNGAYPFHVWAGHPVRAGDHGELTQLIYYLLAPPLRDEHLSIDAAGNVVIKLKRPRHDGTTEVTYTPFGLLDALAELVPRAFKNTIHYHGVYAPNSRLREHAVPKPVGANVPAILCEDLQTIDDRRARAFLHTRTHRLNRNTCPKCFDKLQLVELVSPRFTYRNPNWVAPDIPDGDLPAAFKTAISSTHEHDDPRSSNYRISV